MYVISRRKQMYGVLRTHQSKYRFINIFHIRATFNIRREEIGHEFSLVMGFHGQQRRITCGATNSVVQVERAPFICHLCD